MHKPGRTLTSALLCGAILLFGGLPPASAQAPEPEVPGLELPARIPLEISGEAGIDLGLYHMGSCCVVKSFTGEPPAILEKVPPAEGTNRLFHVLEIRQSKIALSFEDLEGEPSPGSPVLVRADLNQNFDLTDDASLRCRRDEACGPIRTEVQHAEGTAPYQVTLRYFNLGELDFLWYWRSAALVGTVAGRKIAVIDDDSNGTYDDPADLVVLDLDGNGELDGGPEGRESMLRQAAIPWGDAFLSVTEVDPVAGFLTVERAREVKSSHSVIDARTGNRIPGAQVTSHPGPFSAISDSRGKAVLSSLGARPDFVTVAADGYWGKVYGPAQRAGESYEAIRLDPGPCRTEAMHWCGQETLEASSVTQCRLDLDSGVVGPRAGSAPGPWDLGWFAPAGGMLLATDGKAGLAVLDGTDFDTLAPEDLRRLSFDETEVRASEDCNEGPIKGSVAAEGRLRKGAVLGIRTQEGRLGKIRVESCGWELALSWILYEEGDTAGDEPAPASPGGADRGQDTQGSFESPRNY